MKTTKALAFLILGLITVTALRAQTTIPGGYVSGSWTASGSPYNILGNITLHADSALTIEAGTDVIFHGDFSLTVNGNLTATGTPTDSISFFPADTLSPWGGIEVQGTDIDWSYCNISYVDNPNCSLCLTQTIALLSHCTISDNDNTGGPLWINTGADVTINDCTITRNHSRLNGGGLRIDFGAHLNISNCLFSDNSASSEGGAIYGNNASIEISGCIFTNNLVSTQPTGKGGAISLDNCLGTIIDCHFSGNRIEATGEKLGHTICLENSSPVISHCILSKNGLMNGARGGGIHVGENSNPTIDHCVFSLNKTLSYGGAIYVCPSGSMSLTNSIFYRNSYNNIFFSPGCSSSVSFCDFQKDIYDNFFGSGTPSGLGVLTGVNANGDDCDDFMNIFTDPLFMSEDDFHLTEGSPCIDAGDPESPLDPDLTVTDMGRFFFDQSAPEILLSETLLDFGTVIEGHQASKTLKVFNSGLDSLIIDQFFNHQAVFSTDYCTNDSLILPGDSICITVTFLPVSALTVTDTLFINNNDHDTIVELTGTGQSTTGIFNPPDAKNPGFLLGPAYPNPFQSVTSFEFTLPGHSFVMLTVHKMTGDVISTLVSGEMAPGSYKYLWSPGDLPGGIYLVRLVVGNLTESRNILKL